MTAHTVACVPARLDALDGKRVIIERLGPAIEQPALDPERMRELDEAVHGPDRREVRRG